MSLTDFCTDRGITDKVTLERFAALDANLEECQFILSSIDPILRKLYTEKQKQVTNGTPSFYYEYRLNKDDAGKDLGIRSIAFILPQYPVGTPSFHFDFELTVKIDSKAHSCFKIWMEALFSFLSYEQTLFQKLKVDTDFILGAFPKSFNQESDTAIDTTEPTVVRKPIGISDCLISCDALKTPGVKWQ